MSHWMLIESAPKDGTLILVYDADGEEVTVASYSEIHGVWIDCISAEDGEVVHQEELDIGTLTGWRCYMPTKWVPLPEPPEDV